ncbi:MAG: helix-turn-helix domain-containing protein [Alphaproteobacteria bacterium]|nr:helix-turn-helix domain-containing protein [Alphaproteobacteria bacterium]MCB9792976.1 helix-turn-helix domain-containing protein [Alphaproteobacteria bacterium]
MQHVSAAQAAAQLGVKRATLYSYVSRGLLTAVPGEDGRSRRYIAEEVEALRRRAEAGRGHGAVAEGAMGWGQPVVDTRICEISAEGPRYRDRPLEALLDRGFEATCDLLWAEPLPSRAAWREVSLPREALEGRGARSHTALIGLLATLGEGAGPLANSSEERVLARSLLTSLIVARAEGPKAVRAARNAFTLGDALAQVLGVPAAAEALDHALILCAEHELNASSFAARVAASTGAGLHACLIAALATHSGPRHGGASAEVEALVEACARAGAEAGLQRWRETRGPLPGCGHRLYPDGDPRFPLLMDAARAAPFGEHALRPLQQLVLAIEAAGLPAPNLDFGLVALRRAWDLPHGSGALVFLLGRIAGWVAHVLEERERGLLIRPRARYVGV